MLGYWVWDPPAEVFHFALPLLNRPLLWYGVLFALGCLAGYGVLVLLLRSYVHKGGILPDRSLFGPLASTPKSTIALFAQSLSIHVILGGLIGARLVDLLFYQEWHQLIHNPLSWIAIWQGGLASHGGAMGALIGLWRLSKKYRIPFWRCVDLVVIPALIAGVFIRVGNVFNQEILGTASSLPWAVLFLHPADGGALIPRHPVQLYEALCYLLIVALLLHLWYRKTRLAKPGFISALFFLLVFSVRFCLEWVKMEQSVYIGPGDLLTMGQWLSLPFILGGAVLCYRNA